MSSDPPSQTPAALRPAVVTVGDELLLGERENGNQHWLLQRLQALDHPAELAVTLPDHPGTIAHWIAALVARGCRPILVSGGLGGTHDDRTREGVAAGLGLAVELHAECDALLAAHYGDRYTAQRRRMAELPSGCSLLPNPGGAPGFRCGDVYAFPGFPEMLHPMAEAVLAGILPNPATSSVVLDTTLPLAEGDVAMEVEAFSHAHPDAHIGIYPVSGGGPPAVTLRLRVREDDAATREAFEALVAGMRDGRG